MKKAISAIFLMVSFLFLNDISAQSQISRILVMKGDNETKLPAFDVHLGIGRVNGIRAGGRILVSKIISFEAAIGGALPLGLKNIAGFQSNTPIISVGINGHIQEAKHLTVSFISVFLKEYNRPFRLSYLSPNIGIMVISGPGAHFFIRAGPYFEINSSKSGGGIGTNLDLGINIVFKRQFYTNLKRLL